MYKKHPSSGASRKSSVFSFRKVLLQTVRKFTKCTAWQAGRNSSGRITTLSKGKRTLKSRITIVNPSFRDTSLSIVGGLSFNPYHRTMYMLIFSASGAVNYLRASDKFFLFKYTRLLSLFTRVPDAYVPLSIVKKQAIIRTNFFLVLQLPRHQPVNNIELQPGSGATISRSTGSNSIITKIDPRINSSLIRLPSGVRKIISVFSVGHLGKPALPECTKLNITSAGYYSSRGKAPRSRGVAKNPVDHPHGGRTKAIKYPRTPWGKTTKYK